MPIRIKKAMRGLLRRLRDLERRMGLRPEFELKTVLPRAEFERELARQASFAERAGVPFFLLRFFLAPPLPKDGAREEAMERLAEAVCARMRLSDVAGRCADPEESIAVILRGARPEGAACVARAVSDDFDRRVRRASASQTSVPILSIETRCFPSNGSVLASGAEVSPAEGAS